MNTLEQDLRSREIIERVRAEEQARAVLNGSPYSPLLTLFAWATSAAVIFFIHQIVPSDQQTAMMIGILCVLVAGNAADSWMSRRRLEAAITLLKLRDI